MVIVTQHTEFVIVILDLLVQIAQSIFIAEFALTCVPIMEFVLMEFVLVMKDTLVHIVQLLHGIVKMLAQERVFAAMVHVLANLVTLDQIALF